MQPEIKPLSLWQRKLVFGVLLLAFLVSLPAFIFYATGYRYDFTATSPSFTATGAFYVVADVPEGAIYLEDQRADNIRSFRSASYIQGIEPGMHKVHVQAPGVHTWVKELPVMAHMVTEVEAFNLPLIPQVRLIPEYVAETGEAVVFARSTSSPVFEFVSTSTPIYFATTTATSSYRENQEYILVRDLLREQASSTAAIEAYYQTTERQFGFSTTSPAVASTTAIAVGTTTVSRDTLTLFERAGEIYVKADQDGFRQVPHYFCTSSVSEDDIIGSPANVQGALLPLPTTTAPTAKEKTLGACREEILINRAGQDVKSFDFFPTNSNLVLLHLTEGVYVVEIDDRAWQNMQPLYLGKDLDLLIYRGGVFIKEGELIFEVIPEIVGS